ncbi:envelope stress response protein PspG [Erwinia sp. 198]|uniref:envelope stress response protein PspG n=1 Tax=Erwinia sp. 198 TaxID=2022746 RepID=UPI0018F2FEBB|nr:envelope stress response protein PspG [Erwinia sp. 198]
MEIFFVLGFFVMLLLTGVSLLGIILALFVASVVMMFAGLLMVVIKMLPWLALAVAAVWIYRAYRKPSSKTARWMSR